MPAERTVTVTIPATTANLGPAFDCLGLALALYNRVTLRPAPTVRVSVKGEGVGHIPEDESNLAIRAAYRLLDHIDQPRTGFVLEQENAIPVSSGLGSSAATVLGGLLAVNALHGEPLSRQEILALAAGLEGHPDNVAPALFGGLVLTLQTPEGLLIESLGLPLLQILVVLPDYELSTAQARAALPASVPLNDAVFNVGRALLLARALEQGNGRLLKIAMEDRLHQPYRLPLIPGMESAFAAAYNAGAVSVALSGAGPSLVIFLPQQEPVHHIVEAVGAAFSNVGLNCRHWLLPVDQTGTVVAVH